MEVAIRLSSNDKPQIPGPLIITNNTNLKDSKKDVIEKSIIANSTSMHIIFNHTIEYSKGNSYTERKVIDVKAELEINKILRTQKNIYLSLFIISILGILISWVPGILENDVGLVLKPLSIAFSLMVVIHYYCGRAR